MKDPYGWEMDAKSDTDTSRPVDSVPTDHNHKYGLGNRCLVCGEIENQQKDSIPIEDHDSVQKPSHYRFGTLETIEVIKGSMPTDQYIGYLKGNIIKYICRAQYKNGKEDLDKAIKYLQWLKDVI